ncbi:hypothetical protein PABG_11648 [Paracoccidioides brasiliensis Pb03]|nr:hypothetical protein PABG_11648 [Paracoccidioides brasiliensis Pb03]
MYCSLHNSKASIKEQEKYIYHPDNFRGEKPRKMTNPLTSHLSAAHTLATNPAFPNLRPLIKRRSRICLAEIPTPPSSPPHSHSPLPPEKMELSLLWSVTPLPTSLCEEYSAGLHDHSSTRIANAVSAAMACGSNFGGIRCA